MDQYQCQLFYYYYIYPDIPKEPSAPLEPQSYRLKVIQSKQQGLLKLGERYAKKYSKYRKTLDRLVWLNACSSNLSIASGISSVVILSTFICLPISIPLGAVSLAGASVSGVATALTSLYQKRLVKVTKLVDIVTSPIAVFETSVSKALNNGEIEEREFDILQELHLKVINDWPMSTAKCHEGRDENSIAKKSAGIDKRDKETLKTRDTS